MVLCALEDRDLLARGQRDDGPVRVAAAAARRTTTDGLAASRHGVDLLHVHAPDLLDGPSDLGLRRTVGDDERVLAALGVRVRLLGDHRLDDDVACVGHRYASPSACVSGSSCWGAAALRAAASLRSAGPPDP